MTLLLTNDEVERLITMRECIAVMREAYAELGEGIGINRTVSQLFTRTAHNEDALYSFKSMDAVAPFAGVAAIRIASEILTWPKDAGGHARKMRIGAAPGGRFTGLVLLFSTTNGEPLAIFPDGVVGRMRVAATSGLAAQYLAREDAREAAILGCGWQAGAQLMAITAARKISRVRCYSPNTERRQAFAQEMRGRTGVEVVASGSPQEAVRGADAVLCATNSFSPVFCAQWIEPGVHIGTVQHFELDPAVFTRADVLAVHYTGGPTPVVASSRGIAQADSMEGMRKKVREALRERQMPNLHDLVLGRTKGRTSEEQVSCFLNYIGLGYQFAAVGSLLYRKAREAGAGRELPTEWFTEDVNP